MLDTPEVPHTLGEVVRSLKTDRDLADVIEDWLQTRSDLDPACVQALHNFRQKAVKERSGVKSKLTSALLLWSNPVDALPFLAGFGVRIMTVLQALGHSSICTGRPERARSSRTRPCKVFFATNDQRTASDVSERLGYQTIKTTSRSVPMGFGHGSGSKSYGLARRELMLAQEVRALGADEAILFKEGALPVRARKIRYYDDRAFAQRLLAPVEIPELTVLRVPPRTFAATAKPETAHEVLSELQTLLRKGGEAPASRS